VVNNHLQMEGTMNVDSIRAYCLSFASATEKLQWGDDLCFKIGGKIFAMLGLDNPRLCFKCDPESFAELIERPDIRPAPYVGRYKWVMLDRLDALSDVELEDMIGRSYAMVAAKAPKSGASRKKSEGRPSVTRHRASSRRIPARHKRKRR
jgi:predicted DNA-binding protein (MmcQ/YjbR family)